MDSKAVLGNHACMSDFVTLEKGLLWLTAEETLFEIQLTILPSTNVTAVTVIVPYYDQYL